MQEIGLDHLRTPLAEFIEPRIELINQGANRDALFRSEDLRPGVRSILAFHRLRPSPKLDGTWQFSFRSLGLVGELRRKSVLSLRFFQP